MSWDKIDDGGSAFPHEKNHFGGGRSDGMTLRDWFAGNVAANQMQLLDYNINEFQAKTTARWAYMVADAMIAARKGGA